MGGLEVLGFYSLGQRLGFRVGVGLGFRDRIPVDEAKGYRFHHSGREFVRFFRNIPLQLFDEAAIDAGGKQLAPQAV